MSCSNMKTSGLSLRTRGGTLAATDLRRFQACGIHACPCFLCDKTQKCTSAKVRISSGRIHLHAFLDILALEDGGGRKSSYLEEQIRKCRLASASDMRTM